MLCLRTRYFTSFCQRMLLYEGTTFSKPLWRSWNWGCRRHKSWICCTWGRHLRNDRGKQNCRSFVVADHERKSQTGKQEDTVSMWSNLHHCLKKWQQYLTLQKVLVIMTVHPVYLFEDKTIWRLYKTMLCFAFAALHIALLPNHWRSFPIKSYQVISWTRTGGSPCKWGDLAKSSPPPPAQTWMTKDTNEELRKNQARTKRWNQRSVVSTQSAHSRWNPSVLMSSWMSSWPIQSSNKTWFRGQDQDVICQMANGIVSLAWVISSLLGVFWVFLSIYFSLPNISMANQKLQNRHFGKVSRTNTKLAKSMKKHVPSSRCWSKYGLIFFPSSEEHWRKCQVPKWNSNLQNSISEAMDPGLRCAHDSKYCLKRDMFETALIIGQHNQD